MPILRWLTRDQDVQAANEVPHRLLEEVSDLSSGDETSRNMLIHGDNLDALKSLFPYFAGKVKCIYIDPPYNTKTAFEHYDDNLEHSKWLAMMFPRLQLLWEFLTIDNGVILISINDDEGHYLKVLCDEVFGRKNFVAGLVWNYEGNTDNQAKIINYHEYILVYSKSGKIDNPHVLDPNTKEASKLNRPQIRNTVVKNGPKNPPKEVCIPKGFPASFEEGRVLKADVRFPEYSSDVVVEGWKTQQDVTATTGWSSRAILESFISNRFRPVKDSKGQDTVFEITPTGAIEAVKERKQEKGHFVSVLRGFGTTNQMRLMLEKLGLRFSFPKPVNLIAYLIEAFTDDDSIVMDSFAGSGTTAHAVLQLNHEKQSDRRFIVVEREESNAKDLIVPRLQAVIEGSDVAGLEACKGGYRFYQLGASVFDENGDISDSIRFPELAAHIWFYETNAPWNATESPALGVHDGIGYALLYNGILGDRSVGGGNVLTSVTLGIIRKDLQGIDKEFDGPVVIYGEASRIGEARLKKENITFKQTPYDVKAR